MHVPVLLQPTIELLDIKEGEIVVDATLGLAGHAREMAERIGKQGILIGFEADANLLAKAEKNLKAYPCRQILINDNFRQIKDSLDKIGIKKVNKILFDLGLNSEQFELSGRGFSFQRDEPLLMTLNPDPEPNALTAYEIINTWDETNLADIIYSYGEEKLSRRIAKAIVVARAIRPLNTTFDLVTVIKQAVPLFYTKQKIHFATRTFQALRIAVNDELGALQQGLAGAWEKLSDGGRLAAISFHSLEASLVKKFFQDKVICSQGKLITKKVIQPSFEEKINNPRSRSAQLRVIEKIIFS